MNKNDTQLFMGPGTHNRMTESKPTLRINDSTQVSTSFPHMEKQSNDSVHESLTDKQPGSSGSSISKRFLHHSKESSRRLDYMLNACDGLRFAVLDSNLNQTQKHYTSQNAHKPKQTVPESLLNIFSDAPKEIP